MKIGLYSPYLDSLGGGERYLLTLAQLLRKIGQVEVFWPDKVITGQSQERLGLDLDGVKLNRKDVGRLLKNPYSRWRVMRSYDRFFWVSDGSIPFLFARKNFLIFQFPFPNLPRSTLTQLKLKLIDRVIVYSKFCQSIIDQSLGTKSQVVYPPVQAELFKRGRKKRLIVAVGRFAKHYAAKKQEVLIRVFQKLCQTGLTGWRLVLVGGILPGDQDYLLKLKKAAAGWPVDFLANTPFPVLVKILAEAEIFWHAAGFGENPLEHPERMEHFGMAVVEAQAAGCIPVVYGGGGLTEIVEDGINGYLWRTEEELLEKTKILIAKGVDPKMQGRTRQDSRRFSREAFAEKMGEIFK